MPTRISLIAIPVLLLGFATTASAQEFCVTCTGPDATYRCVIGGEVSTATRSSRGQFLCITELARTGHHASCSAARGQATPCPGETRTVMFPADEPAVPPMAEPLAPASPPMQPAQSAPPPAFAPAPVPQQAQPQVPHDQQAVQPPPEAPPTEAKPNAVEQIAKKTGEAVTETGNAVGNAMKKTWTCVTSLFGNC